MDPTSFAALHGSYGPELTGLEYLFRVLVSMLALGAIALLVVWLSSGIEIVRSGFSAALEPLGAKADRIPFTPNRMGEREEESDDK